MQEQLSYILQKQTEEMIELHKRIEKDKHSYWLIGLAVTSMYFLINTDRYISMVFPWITPMQSPNLWLRLMDFFILGSFGTCALATAYCYKQREKLKKKFQNLKEKIVAKFEGDFCTCGATCSCRNEYIQTMEKHGIRLWD